MKKTKLAAIAMLGVSLGLGGTSALAKDHDMGVVGTQPKIQTGQFSKDGGVLRLVFSDPGQTYGQSVASVAKGDNRVVPVVVPGGGPNR